MDRAASLAGIVANPCLSHRQPGSSVTDRQLLNRALHHRKGATVRNHMLIRAGWLAAVLLTLTMLWPAPALAVLATFTDDTYADATSVNSARGNAKSVRVQAQGGKQVEIGLLRWNLNLPAGVTSANISKATLMIFIESVSAAGSVDVHRARSRSRSGRGPTRWRPDRQRAEPARTS
jgi:hypothetical protein